MSRTFFHSSIPRGIDFITPRLLESSPKFAEDLENTQFRFLALKYEKKGENFQKFVKIFQFLFLFFWITNQFLVLLPNILNFEI